MKKHSFSKILSANDVGATGAHQAGILIPKTESDLLEFLPKLSVNKKNPDTWLHCQDENGVLRKFRYVYYNNRLHDLTGTRNEFRVTHMTKYFKEMGAKEGDRFEISKSDDETIYKICVKFAAEDSVKPEIGGLRIRLSPWRKIY